MPRTKLASGAVFEIVEEDDIVSCLVVNREDVGPEEGAACVRQMHEFLTNTVLANRSWSSSNEGVATVSATGFVTAVDLVPRATCPSSNQGEYYYSIAPDPAGEAGP